MAFFMEKTCLNKKLFYLFEANKKHEQIIKLRGFKYHIGVLSNEIKDIKFYSKNHQGDSYYLEQTNFYEQNLKPENIKSDTLDSVVKKNKFEFPDFIKIDTQGSELDILKGGSNTLSTCKLIYLECPVIDYNKNSPKFVNYIQSLNSLGYVPIDVCDISYVDKVLIQIDILFIKKNLINKYYRIDKILNILN